MKIPFETVTIALKQVRFSELEPIERKNLNFFFPGYADDRVFEEYEFPQSSPMHGATDRGFDVVQDNSVPRRFAGDFSLPRSRYYTVCRNSKGEDGGTLVNELRAYGNAIDTGFYYIVDSAENSEAAAYFRQYIISDASALFCVIRDTPSFPSPYANLVEVDRRVHRDLLVAVIPTTISMQTFERVIDLRIPETRDWFVRAFTNAKDEITGQHFFPVAGPLDDFSRILPSLLAQGIGDPRGATQGAGLWLRTLGAEALIFPSARSNAFVECKNGHIGDFAGWNLVDYRDAPDPTIKGFVDFSPEWDEFPIFGHHKVTDGPDSEADPVVYRETRILTDGDGALSIEGLAEQIEQAYSTLHWFHFSKRFKQVLETDRANAFAQIAFLLAGATDGQVVRENLAKSASMLVMAVLGEEAALQNLRNIKSAMIEAGSQSEADLLSDYIEFCISEQSL